MRAYLVLRRIWQKHFLKRLPLGIIESELVAIPAMQNGWKRNITSRSPGNCY